MLSRTTAAKLSLTLAPKLSQDPRNVEGDTEYGMDSDALVHLFGIWDMELSPLTFYIIRKQVTET